MLYLGLLKNQWKGFIRALRRKRIWIVSLVLVPAVLYIALVLILLGLFFDRLFRIRRLGINPVELLDSNLLTLFMGMFALRFFFQRPPRMEIQPYLHLPIERKHLIRYFQVVSLASVHNLYPLLFLVPFWIRFMYFGPHDLGPSLIWLGAMISCILLIHYLNTYIRIVLDRHTLLFVVLMGGFFLLQILDQALGTQIIFSISALLFDPVAEGRLLYLFFFLALTLGIYLVSSHALATNLRAERTPSVTRRPRAIPAAFSFGNSPILNLIFLELKMMWRNKRAKHYVVISVGVSTAYTALLLSDYNAFYGSIMAAIIGLFASGVFALNYGQLMFAWESRYFDGLLARDIRPDQMVLAKFMILEGSCLLLFLASLPLFFWLAPELLMLHVAFLFYNAGVTSMLMVGLAVLNRRRVNASEGSFFNYQGFSILHWLWVIPTILPPALVLYFMSDQGTTPLVLIALFGLGNMLLAWPWSKLLARFLSRRKHRMAAGFRTLAT